MSLLNGFQVRDASVIWLLAFFGWLFALTWLSLAPTTPETQMTLLDWDKFRHAIAYAILAVLAVRALRSIYGQDKKIRLRAFIFTAAYGGLLEILQELLTAVRSAEIGDFTANATGAAIALFVGKIRDCRRGLAEK